MDNKIDFEIALKKLAEFSKKSLPDGNLQNKLEKIVNHINNLKNDDLTEETKSNIIQIVTTLNDISDLDKQNIKQLHHLFTNKEYRILDSIAKLLTGRSECVAALILKDKMYLAANEIQSNSTGKNIQQDFKKIKEFLNSKNEDVYGGILNTICPYEFFQKRLKDGVGIFPPVSYDKAIEFVKEHKKNMNYDVLKKTPGVGYNAGVIAHMATDINEQQENLRKVIYYFNNHHDFKKQLESAEWIYNFNQLHAIKTSKGIKNEFEALHAEMRLLAIIIEKIKTGEIEDGERIYIGISKSCCFKCHYSIEAANEVLLNNGYNIKIVFREAHDLNFKNKEAENEDLDYKKWAFPASLSKEKKCGILGQEIINAAKDRFAKEEPKTNVNQQHTIPSDSVESSGEEFNPAEEDKDRLKKLITSLNDVINTFPTIYEQLNKKLILTELLLNVWNNKECATVLKDLIVAENTSPEEVSELFTIFCNCMQFNSENEIKKLYKCLTGESAHINIRNSFSIIDINDISLIKLTLGHSTTQTTTSQAVFSPTNFGSINLLPTSMTEAEQPNIAGAAVLFTSNTIHPHSTTDSTRTKPDKRKRITDDQIEDDVEKERQDKKPRTYKK